MTISDFVDLSDLSDFIRLSLDIRLYRLLFFVRPRVFKSPQLSLVPVLLGFWDALRGSETAQDPTTGRAAGECPTGFSLVSSGMLPSVQPSNDTPVGAGHGENMGVPLRGGCRFHVSMKASEIVILKHLKTEELYALQNRFPT